MPNCYYSTERTLEVLWEAGGARSQAGQQVVLLVDAAIAPHVGALGHGEVRHLGDAPQAHGRQQLALQLSLIHI